MNDPAILGSYLPLGILNDEAMEVVSKQSSISWPHQPSHFFLLFVSLFIRERDLGREGWHLPWNRPSFVVLYGRSKDLNLTTQRRRIQFTTFYFLDSSSSASIRKEAEAESTQPSIHH
jgi:hypothetical protein